MRWFGVIGILLLDATMAFTLALLLHNTALAAAAFIAGPITMGALGQSGELAAKITAWIRALGTSL